ncbi:hypothetical protein IMSAGC017_00635 [Thomasclavelia cocleata]|uniref:Toxin secretion/phage lysis holin n=1 Tax=Thomasclavelia cocleata TaxID=69824 RepID=A0A829Z7U6_9FIRM|nr:phage holin family protein [Thomasclavelia cocleata]GFI40600.1 hypothetical protein IMSAGC017_00635 [Thomasclavelia cocleata]
MKKKLFKVCLILVFLLILFNVFISKDDLVIFLTSTIIIDYIMGVYIAYFLKKSNNSPDGSLNSKAGYLGIMKKVGILIMVWIGYEIDINFSLDICKNMITIGYLINEIISINENLAIIGLKKNTAIKKIITILENLLKEDQ